MPDPPTNVQVTQQGSVSFTAPSYKGNPTLTAYTVEAVPAGASLGDAGNPKASGAASPIQLPGLTDTTVYTVYVRAQNSQGLSSAAGAVQLTASIPVRERGCLAAHAASVRAHVPHTCACMLRLQCCLWSPLPVPA